MRKAILSLLMIGLLTAPAFAQDARQERARELYQNGAILYEEGRYDDAIAAWQEAYRLSEKPELLFNIANAQERSGHYEDALDTLSRYRAYAAADEREALDRRIRNLERRAEEAAAAAPTTAAPTTTPPPTAPPPVTPTPQPQPQPLPSASGPRILPVSLLTVGAVGLGAGALFGVQARAARVEASGLCVTGAAGTLCGSEAADALARDRSRSLLADVSFGVGAAAIAGGALTLLLGGETSVSVSPTAITLGRSF